MDSLENTSQVVLRQQHLLLDDLLLVCPKADRLAFHLSKAEGTARISALCWDYGSYLIQKQHAEASFSIKPPMAWRPKQIILFMPKARDLLALMISSLATQITGAEKVWLVGEKREGIESAAKNLHSIARDAASSGDSQTAQHLKAVKLDAARHSQLWEFSALPSEDDQLEKYWRHMAWQIPKVDQVNISCLPGVFSFGRLDPGTQLLLTHLPRLRRLHSRVPDRILDFGCGCGVIGFALAQLYPQLQIEMVDTNLLALESVRRSLSLQPGTNIKVSPSVGLAEVDKGLSAIVSNPPFHQGIRQDVKTTQQFLKDCSSYLLKGGSLILVANRFLPYAQWIENHIGKPDTLAEDSKYKVYHAVKR